MPSPKKCLKCFNHGVQSIHSTAECPITHCACRKCVLNEERRAIFQRLNVELMPEMVQIMEDKGETSRYTCSKCRRHGIVVMKKYHEPCPFTVCQCEICALTIRKGAIDRELASITRLEKIGGNNDVEILGVVPSPQSSADTNPFVSPEVKVILDLLILLTTAEEPDNFDSIDYVALKNLLSMPTIDLPTAWLPHLPVITELVYIAMAKLPCFKYFNFDRQTSVYI